MKSDDNSESLIDDVNSSQLGEAPAQWCILPYWAALSLSFRRISIWPYNVNEHNSLGSPGNILPI